MRFPYKCYLKILTGNISMLRQWCCNAPATQSKSSVLGKRTPQTLSKIKMLQQQNPYSSPLLLFPTDFRNNMLRNAHQTACTAWIALMAWNGEERAHYCIIIRKNQLKPRRHATPPPSGQAFALVHKKANMHWRRAPPADSLSSLNHLTPTATGSWMEKLHGERQGSGDKW